MVIKAIETRYAGCRFRSRLEARWAVFFDAMGIEWLYEPQGYLVGAPGDEMPYLPDFYLPGTDIFAEVKGIKHKHDIDVLFRACGQYGLPASQRSFPGIKMLLLGNIPRPVDNYAIMHHAVYHYPAGHNHYTPPEGVADSGWWEYDGVGIWQGISHFTDEGKLDILFSPTMNLSTYGKPNISSPSFWNFDPYYWEGSDYLGPDNQGSATYSSYVKARSARFEHGEKG